MITGILSVMHEYAQGTFQTLLGVILGFFISYVSNKKHGTTTEDIKTKSMEILKSMENDIKSRLDQIISDATEKQSQDLAIAIFNKDFQTKILDNLPENTDLPHIKSYYEDGNPINPGKELRLICRFRDTGINFNIELGTHASLKLGNREIRANVIQYLQGHAILTIKIPQETNPCSADINIRMTDNNNNSFEQTIPVMIGYPPSRLNRQFPTNCHG